MYIDPQSPAMKVSNPRFNAILYNRFVLYFVVFVSLVNLYTLATSDRPIYAVMFLLVGFLTSFFSKNMTVILVVAIALTNLVKSGSGRGLEGFQEGAEDQTESESDDSSDKKGDDKNGDDKKGNDKKGDDKDVKKKVDEVKKEIIKDGKQLLELQENIVGGFKEIEPYMTQAEALAAKIEKSAGTIEGLKQK
jgi:hypothetical protein